MGSQHFSAFRYSAILALSVFLFGNFILAAETPQQEVASAFDRAVEEHAKATEILKTFKSERWSSKELDGWVTARFKYGTEDEVKRSEVLDAFIKKTRSLDEKSRAVCLRIAAGYLGDARPQYRAVACEVLSQFPLESLIEGYLPALGRCLDDKAKAFDGIQFSCFSQTDYIHVTKLPDGVHVGDIADFAIENITSISFPNAKVFEAWWKTSKDFRHSVWYWELRWNQVGDMQSVIVSDSYGQDRPESRRILHTNSEFPLLLREFSKEDALKILLLVGNGDAVTPDEWNLLQPYHDFVLMETMRSAKIGIAAQTIAKFVELNSLMPQLIELVRQDPTWPEASNKQAKRAMLRNLVETLRIASRPSDVAALESALKNPSPTLKDDGVCQTTLTLLLIKLAPERLEEILLAECKKKHPDARLAVKLIRATGLKHWGAMVQPAKNREFRKAILPSVGTLRSPEAAKLLNELLIEDFSQDILHPEEGNPFALHYLLEKYVEAAVALNGNQAVDAQKPFSHTFWVTTGKGEKKLSEREERLNAGVPAARNEAVKLLKVFFEAEAKKPARPNELPPTDTTDLEKQTDQLLARIRHGDEKEQAMAAKEAIQWISKLDWRKEQHFHVNAPWRDTPEPEIETLHLRAGEKCRIWIIELAHAIYLNAPRCPSAIQAVSWLERYANGEHKVGWCNVLLREYSREGDHDTYSRLGYALDGVDRHDDASKAFLRSFMLNNNVGHWDEILSHDAQLADPAFLAKFMPEAAKEFAEREKNASVRLKVELVSTAAPKVSKKSENGDATDGTHMLPGKYRVTAEYMVADKPATKPLRNVLLYVMVFPSPHRGIRQMPSYFGDSKIWESERLTLEPGKPVSYTFAISEYVPRDRPFALLANFAAFSDEDIKKGRGILTIFGPPPSPVSYWSQPLMVKHLIKFKKDDPAALWNDKE